MNTQRTDIIAEIERRRMDLSLGLLKIYHYYRIFVGFALLIAYKQILFSTKLGELDPQLFWWTAIVYTTINIALTGLTWVIPRKWFNRHRLIFALVIFDG